MEGNTAKGTDMQVPQGFDRDAQSYKDMHRRIANQRCELRQLNGALKTARAERDRRAIRLCRARDLTDNRPDGSLPCSLRSGHACNFHVAEDGAVWSGRGAVRMEHQ